MNTWVLTDANGPAMFAFNFSRRTGGTLVVTMRLTSLGQEYFGAPVEVWVPLADINGVPVSSPYGPHTEPSSYYFHFGILKFEYPRAYGGGTHTLQTGDMVAFLFDLKSLDSAAPGLSGDALAYCSVPPTPSQQ